ncbi:hypothetical protein BDK51DRAFT_51357, partial [Blyttiomyces helicus]
MDAPLTLPDPPATQPRRQRSSRAASPPPQGLKNLGSHPLLGGGGVTNAHQAPPSPPQARRPFGASAARQPFARPASPQSKKRTLNDRDEGGREAKSSRVDGPRGGRFLPQEEVASYENGWMEVDDAALSPSDAPRLPTFALAAQLDANYPTDALTEFSSSAIDGLSYGSLSDDEERAIVGPEGSPTPDYEAFDLDQPMAPPRHQADKITVRGKQSQSQPQPKNNRPPKHRPADQAPQQPKSQFGFQKPNAGGVQLPQQQQPKQQQHQQQQQQQQLRQHQQPVEKKQEMPRQDSAESAGDLVAYSDEEIKAKMD